jgi:transglutaminase-like putative cysteine protease
VSGYLIQLPAPNVDSTELHVWCEVCLPGAGWIGLDATSGLLVGADHLPLACAPTPAGAAPVEGAVDHCAVRRGHSVQVRRIEPPQPRQASCLHRAREQAVNTACSSQTKLKRC